MQNDAVSTIGIVIYPDVTELDATGPYQAFAFTPSTRVHLLWKNLEPVRSACGLVMLPTTSFADCPHLDVLLVPGGPGTIQVMNDSEVLDFLRRSAQDAGFITSVCMGSLVLAAAGLLKGYRAACHWAFRDDLALFGVEVGTERVVVDRNRITGGGVTAGIDFSLALVEKLRGEETAKIVQLLMEYNPAPPLNAGSPETAGPDIVAAARAVGKDLLEHSRRATEVAVARLAASTRVSSD
jgi:cyclohexyl-isocyanide hydratase